MIDLNKKKEGIESEELSKKYFKDGIEIDKGVILTSDRILKNRDLYQKYCDFFTAYPDLFIDLITPKNSNFKLFYYQRIFLRACLRYRYHYCVAPRAFSKTFVSMLGMFLKCIFQPGSKVFICAPQKEQSAKIAKEKLMEIFDLFPILKKELLVENYGNDYVKLVLRNGSVFDVVGALESTRGGRRHSGLVDEVRDHDGDTLNEVVLPLLNVNRRTKGRIVNPNEPHQAQLYMTSAGAKSSFAYEKLIECLVNEIINPRDYFIWGCDYRIPLFHGLLDKKYLNEIKMSSTYKEDSFAREYLGLWTGGSTDSWFNYNKLSRFRTLVNPEKSQKIEDNPKFFYLLSVDVARLGCQTVVSVFKVYRRTTEFNINLVNMYVLGKTAEDKHFAKQAVDLKKLIKAYNPLEVVIDGNGLGVGLLDFMIKPSIDYDGIIYPGYGCKNDDSYKKIQDKGLDQIIYVIKANGTSNSKIHGNCYSKINGGHVHFLITEQEAKNKLLSTKRGQKMKPEKRIERLMPHEMTTKLFEEMANLRLKPTGNGLDIVLEQINKRKTKDKFSSFEYGLWRIKEIEEEYYKKWKRKTKQRNLVFYTEGGH